MHKKSRRKTLEEKASLADLLADPILWMVMKADHVGETELMRLLGRAAPEGRPPLPSGGSGRDHESGKPTQYRPGVGIMLLNDADEVFVGSRRQAGAPSWQMPQGGIAEGETPRAAALRELKEEIGTDEADILAESDRWLFYDLPVDLIGKAWHGRWRGQRQKWFVMRYKGQDADIRVESPCSEFTAWKWVGFDALPDLIVSFKRPLYLDLLDEFAGNFGSAGARTDLS